MVKKNIEELVTEIVLPITEKHKFELVDVEYIKEGPYWYLRIYIDKPGGITIDDCQLISEEIDPILDKKNFIEQSYFLEVSSPGLERPLRKDKDFEKFKGEPVEVKLFAPIDGKKVFEGELVGLIDNKIVIKKDTAETVEFDRDKVSSVRRIIKF
ncbi:ribosome maturation factor RimP [Clostridium thermosuccinogenes]|jgi:ribosome maturation factor RimP|uniref:Ribosome maturation factor RimP n=1 Tax=Clostridium thermosuccinogenes TaxID=84032 RepID=A0A2K2FKW4_9CLOT|nr:ribosome maturation factor RimP [Pseudoclostridium thermosuccinogenes]AUS96021.1 ribosome maturation factor RimP [Pseudoclostridium thermosuccinogenes]PNT93255.1 ribosome maturation factor RimP [Pseudoclostridium thermosuccinogenes]PNT99410.1 ribosome maturation factor RimP [Pseudoclostridium thermosuccinogenes]PNU01097.1 ribosome maturation factor RimP [Pseudoclostridium thermosuccinogenes]